MSKLKTGFTLIELLVVIAIIGVLMAIGFVAFKQAQAAGRDAKRKSDLAQIRAAIELLKKDCSSYPSELGFGSPLTRDCDADDNEEIYMSEVPQDSLSDQGYGYTYRTTPTGYVLCAYLERGGADAGCINQCGNFVCNYKVDQP